MKTRHTPEQIVRKLRQADEKLAAGAPIPELTRQLMISEATLHRWRNRYGGINADAVKHLKELEKENPLHPSKLSMREPTRGVHQLL